MKLLLNAAGVIALIVPSAASAQESRDIRVRVGLGAQLQPDWIGADKLELGPLVDIDIARDAGPFRFEAPDDNFGIRLYSRDGLTFGPSAKIEGSRKDSDVGVALGKVDTTVEVGAFAQYEANASFRVRGDVRKGLNGHEGLVGSIGADWMSRDGDKYVFSVGPRLLFSNARYERAYFEVTPAASIASGLPVYRPDGGLHATALASGISYQFTPRFGFFGYGRYERLIGDAAKSPIVRVLGSRNQWSGGVGLSYTFSVKR